MKVYKTHVFMIVMIALLALAFSGCESDTVGNFIVSDRQYTDISELDRAKQPGQLAVGQDIYASVYFIESPKGMEYTAKWFINGTEVKSDTREMQTDTKGIIVFTLEGYKTFPGTLKFQVNYKDVVLDSRELAVVKD